jgi:hypothetical protein
LLFNKIKNENIRELALSLTNIAGAYLMVCFAFLIKHISFSYYWFVATVFCGFSIIWYWLYKHTKLKKLIAKIGYSVVKKLAVVVKDKVNNFVDGMNIAEAFVNELTEEIENPKKAKSLSTVETAGLKKSTVSQDNELNKL